MKKLLYLFTALLLTFNLSAQEEPEFLVALLENDNIADVNINQDTFIKSIGNMIDLSKEEFKAIKSNQKIAILITAHKSGKPTIEFHSNPKIGNKQKESFLKKMTLLPLENTKLVDFPMLILMNSKFEDYSTDFKGLVSPIQKRFLDYNNATLNEKYELNKAYAIEVLTVLRAYQTNVDEQFVGVRNMGDLLTETNFKKKQDITKLLSKNQDYWRATLEMNIGNQLIPITKIFTLVSQGEFDHALKYIEIIRMFSNPKSVSANYLEELLDRLNLFSDELNSRIKQGFAFHDSGKYQKAVDIYNDILSEYPNSAWAKYEAYYSENALLLETKELDLNDRSHWDKSKVGIYESNPLYNMDVRASNGKEGYLLFRRLSIAELFKEKDNKMGDVYEYATIALELEVYDFAAQLFWIVATFDKEENDAIFRFLYAMEKLGVTELKSNFEGNFKKEFAKIEKNLKKQMESSPSYKSFKK